MKWMKARTVKMPSGVQREMLALLGERGLDRAADDLDGGR
jgi:hypothetical protein